MTAHPIGATVRVRDDVPSLHAGKTGTVAKRLDDLPNEPRPVLVRFPFFRATALYADAELETVTSPDATTSTGQLLDIEPGPPARAWHAATPPVCPECGVSHEYPVWADRDALRSLYAERDRALARIERLREWGKYWHGCADAFYYERDGDAPLLQPGDLDAAPGGEGGTDGQD